MPRPAGGARVLGPYHDAGRGRWIVVQVGADGTRTTHYAKSEREANQLRRACLIDLGIPDGQVFTVELAVAAFVQHKRETGAWSDRTFERTGADLKAFAASAPDAPIGAVGIDRMRSYLARLAPLALDSQRSRFAAVVEFLRWCVRRGHLKANPADLVDPSEKPWTGKRARRLRGRGKPQLRNQAEARAYLATALALPRPDHRVAASLPLLDGLRSGELRHLQVADIDFAAGKIWIRYLELEDDDDDDGWDVKTAASRRTVDLPAVVRADLEALCEGREPTALLFPSTRNPGAAWDRRWLNRMVQRVCGAAGVRVICAHGLRDTYTSLMATLGRRSAEEIAELVGHGDDGATARRHYIGAPEHEVSLDLGPTDRPDWKTKPPETFSSSEPGC